MSSRVRLPTAIPLTRASWKAISSPSRVIRTSNSIMSAPMAIALVNASIVFSAAPAATPRCAATMTLLMLAVCPVCM